MPYTLRWTGGAGTGHFGTAANWLDEGTGTAHVAGPATGDTCKILSGNWNINDGLSQSAVDLADFIIGPDFTGAIGTTGTSLTISVAGTLNYNGRASTCNIAAGSADITRIKVQQAISTFFLTGGTTANLEVGRSGNVHVTSAAVLTNLYGTGGNCILEYNATPITLCEWSGGRLETGRILTAGEVDGNGLVVTTGVASAGAFKVSPGSRLNIRSSGTFTGLKAKPDAKVDAEGNIYSFTVSTLTRYAGSKAFVDEAITPTISAEVKIGYN